MYLFTKEEIFAQLKENSSAFAGKKLATGLNLSFCELQGVNLSGANLNGVKLNHANLTGANLEEASLEAADLYGAHLQGANLQGANLKKVDLEKAILVRTDLSNANLEQADLSWADLKGANLSGANVFQACFRQTKCSEANFVGARHHSFILAGSPIFCADHFPYSVTIFYDNSAELLVRLGCQARRLNYWKNLTKAEAILKYSHAGEVMYSERKNLLKVIGRHQAQIKAKLGIIQ